jgi:DDE family transposase
MILKRDAALTSGFVRGRAWVVHWPRLVESVAVAYMRTVKTASGATAVQIVYSKRRGARRMEHVGSAHDERELEALKAAARQRLAGGQQELELGVNAGDDAGLHAVAGPGPVPIVASRMGHLWDGLCRAYDLLGFGEATGGDVVFRDLVLARIIEPTSKADSLRVLAEVGVETMSYRTLNRRLPGYATQDWRHKLAMACAAHAKLGPAALVLYDVSTLYFETETGDGFREPGYSKERRLEPQITIGLLTDASGFPLTVEAFEGNRAETTTMLPTIEAFMAAHKLADVTVVADAGMISAANKKAIEDAGLSFILGMKIPNIPYAVAEWRREHPDEQMPDGLILTQPWPAGPADKRRDQVIYYQYKADRARRTLRGIDEQVSKAEKAVAGKVPVKRNRFIKLVGADKSVNRTLEAKTRALAGIKGYITNLPDPNPEFVIGAYHRLFEIEASFRMSKHDLAARPIYHHKRESIEAHLNIVFAALAVSRLVEDRTGWSIRKFVRTARRYRTVQIRVGQQILTAEDPLPADLREALAIIH